MVLFNGQNETIKYTLGNEMITLLIKQKQLPANSADQDIHYLE